MAAKTKKKASEKKSDVDLVKESAAAPHASLAGSEYVLETEGVPVRITVIDGARASIEVTSSDPLTQADLQTVGKLIDQAVQGTY